MNAIFAAGEREQLEAMLDNQRAELLAALDGLSEADGRARLVPSATTVLGLVKHSFVLDPSDTVASVRAGYEAAIAVSREVAARHRLDETFESRHGWTNLRWIHLHMIAELARHAGHADIVVEQLHAGVPEAT